MFIKGVLMLPSLSALLPLVILGRTRSYHHVASTAREQTDRFVEVLELLTPSCNLSHSNTMTAILSMAVTRACILIESGVDGYHLLSWSLPIMSGEIRSRNLCAGSVRFVEVRGHVPKSWHA